MHKDRSQRLGIVGLEALDHELDRRIIHVSHREARHIKYDALKQVSVMVKKSTIINLPRCQRDEQEPYGPSQ